MLLHFDADEAERIFRDAFSRYKAQRGLTGDQLAGQSIEQIESHISSTRDAMNNLTVPDRLHPADLFKRSTEVTQARIDVAKRVFPEGFQALLTPVLSAATSPPSSAIDPLNGTHQLRPRRRQFRILANYLKALVKTTPRIV